MNQPVELPLTQSKHNYRHLKNETLFVPISLLFGIVFLIITSPFQVADESRHFARAYQLAERGLAALSLIPTQERLPASLVSAIKQTDYLHSQSGPKATVNQLIALTQSDLQPTKRAGFNEFASYSFVSYLPQILVIAPLRLAEVNAVITLYVARLIALLFWVAMTYWAIRIVPIARQLFFFIVLLPMTVFQAGSTSADSVTFALSFLLTAIYLRLAYKSVRVTPNDLLITAVLGTALTAAKLVYAPLIGLHFLISGSKFRSSAWYIGSFVLISCACFLVLASPLNSLFAQVTAPELAPTKALDGLTPYPQLNFLLSSPLNILQTAAATFLRFGRSYMNGFVGILGWYGASLPSYLEVVAVIMLWLTTLTTITESTVSLKQRIILALIVLTITAAICVGISTDGRENPVPTFQMRGIQGRYFTPFALLIGLLAANKANFFLRYQRFVKPAVLPFVIFLLVNAVFSLLERYYA